MSASQCVQTHLGQTPVQNLALRHQILNCAGHILDRYLRVDAVLVDEVNAVSPEPLEHPIHSLLYVVRLAVEPHFEATGLGIYVPAELRRDHHVIAERCDALTQDALAFERSVSLSR